MPFQSTKIYNAIIKAMQSVGVLDEKVASDIANEIEDKISRVKNHTMYIFEIEKDVFYGLLNKGCEDTARAYEGYRAVREFQRKSNTIDESVLSLVDGKNKYVMEENSNKNAFLLSTQRDLIAGEVSKDIVRRKILPPHIVQAHDDCVLHFHDMDYMFQSMGNCCLINLKDMLDNGTVINDKLVESPKSFATACTIATQIMAQVASNQYGGQSITIAHLAPYLRKSYKKYFNMYLKDFCVENLLPDIQPYADDFAKRMTKRELKDGVQTIRYQLSTLQTTNGQSPFATIYLEIIEGDEYEEEMALICQEMIKQRIEGMKNEKGQEIGEAFPKLIYVLDEHNCLKGGKYDYITKLAAECSAKRLVPDYQSAKIMRQNYGDNFPAMGCRSHLSPYKDKDGNLKWYGRWNQGVVSINLTQIAIIANGDMEKFWKMLDERLELCKEALMIRHDNLKGTPAIVSPIHWRHGALARLGVNDTIDELLENGYSTLSLGYVGIYEMTQAMLGVSHTTPEGEKFAVEVMKHMKEKCDEWKAESGLGFSLYGTPAESLIYRFCKHDKEQFGEIPNVTDRLYYTNSYHVFVGEEIDAFSKLKFESQFHAISSGGCISYVEVPNMQNNIKAVEEIIKFIYDNVQYAEINTKADVCYECGYTGEMKLDENLEWYCPSCGNRNKNMMQVMRRTCGYLGDNFWNKGKTQEISERVTHL